MKTYMIKPFKKIVDILAAKKRPLETQISKFMVHNLCWAIDKAQNELDTLTQEELNLLPIMIKLSTDIQKEGHNPYRDINISEAKNILGIK